uniref:Uncharacterized protein n=1 Tax=Nothobranchius korthausae TaxID=1143690 RepID=A0A1A8EN43_9TELE
MQSERKMSHRDYYWDVFSVLEDKEDFSECFYSQPALLTGEFYQQRTSQNKHDTQPSHSQIINDQHLLPTLPMSACFSTPSFSLSCFCLKNLQMTRFCMFLSQLVTRRTGEFTGRRFSIFNALLLFLHICICVIIYYETMILLIQKHVLSNND